MDKNNNVQILDNLSSKFKGSLYNLFTIFINLAVDINYKPKTIICGNTGSGKTTLKNKLCSQNHLTGSSKASVTRKLTLNDVSHGKAFEIIDTPGTDSKEEAYSHAYLLKQGLTSVPLSTIFIVMQFKNRFEKLVEEYLTAMDIFGVFEHKVVVMISHWDNTKAPEKDFKEILETFGENDITNINLICYSENSDTSILSNRMYLAASNMKNESLNISDTDFFLKFNFGAIKLKMQKHFTKYEKEADELYKQFENLSLIEDINPNEKDEFYHMLLVSFKEEYNYY